MSKSAIYGWYMSTESMRRKFRRHVLGEINYMPESLRQCENPMTSLQASTVQTLSKVFLDCDRSLKFGVVRMHLINAYKRLGVLVEEKEIERFKRESGYGRKVSQKKQWDECFGSRETKKGMEFLSIALSKFLRTCLKRQKRKTQVWQKENSHPNWPLP